MGVVGMLLGTLPAYAHPVAYQGSVGIMGYHSKDSTDLELNYSVRYWLAPSVQVLRLTEGTNRPDVVLGKLNFLLGRWNRPDSQGNLYAHAGYGVSRLSGEQRGAYHLGLTADWEDRRYYVLGQWETLRTSRGTEAVMWKTRAGFAPYVAPFDRLHTWLILEANRKSRGDGRVNIVPFLRFFYENVLWEVGSTLSGDVHFNYIIHL
jgi:hypothetical protein